MKEGVGPLMSLVVMIAVIVVPAWYTVQGRLERDREKHRLELEQKRGKLYRLAPPPVKDEGPDPAGEGGQRRKNDGESGK